MLTVSSAFSALAIIAKLHQINTTPSALRYKRGLDLDETPSTVDIICVAKAIGLKAKSSKIRPTAYATLPTPCMVLSTECSYVVAKVGDTSALVQKVGENPKKISLDELHRISNDNFILFKKANESAYLDGETIRLSFRWFINIYLQERRLLAEILIASFVLQLFALSTPIFFQVVMDKVLVHRGLSTLDVLAMGFMGVIAFEAILGAIRNQILAHAGRKANVIFSSKIFAHIKSVPISYFEKQDEGRISAKFKELNAVLEFLVNTFITLFIDLIFVILFFLVMYLYSPTLTMIVAAFIPFHILILVYCEKKFARPIKKKIDNQEESQSLITQTIAGISTIKGMALEGKIQSKWDQNIAEKSQIESEIKKISTLSSQFATALNRMSTLAILWMGSRMVLAAEITVGQLIAFNMIAARVTMPILKLIQLKKDLKKTSESISRINALLDVPSENINNKKALLQPKGLIELKNITFSYELGREPFLKSIDLRILPGEKIGVIGASGSGKSTISNLIQRFYIPLEGDILLDGKNIKDLDLQWYRKNIMVINQQAYLFDMSVKENLTLGANVRSEEELVSVVQAVGIHDFIESLTEGYETNIVNNGVQLSLGQKQRLMIARALLSSARILIFDEATSGLSLDAETQLMANVNRCLAGRSLIVVTHRVSALAGCNKVFQLHTGCLKEIDKSELDIPIAAAVRGV